MKYGPEKTAEAEFIATMFRLVKLAGMHDTSNAASQRAIARAADRLADLTSAEHRVLSALFTEETVFVNGAPLRARRGLYENAVECGRILQELGFNELMVERGVTADDLRRLLRLVGAKTPFDVVRKDVSEHIVLRRIDPSTVLGRDEDELPIEEQVLSAYSSACVIARRFQQEVGEGEFRLVRYLKRIAQRFATLSEPGTGPFLAIATSSPGADPGRQRVHAAITAILAGRLVTRDLHALMRMAYAALVKDLGAARVSGAYQDGGFGPVQTLNVGMKKRLPASSSLLMLQTGRASEPALSRTITLFEAEWIEQSAHLGALYRKQLPPRAESTIALAAHRFVAALGTTEDPDALVTTVIDQTVGRVNQAANYLIFSALGLRPAGTPVVLADRTRGVVVSAGTSLRDVARPQVVVLIGPNGQAVSPSVQQADVDGAAVASTIHEPSEQLLDAYRGFKQKSQSRATGKSAAPQAWVKPPSPLAGETFGTLERTIER